MTVPGVGKPLTAVPQWLLKLDRGGRAGAIKWCVYVTHLIGGKIYN